VAQLVKRLPLAQVMILESLDRVPHPAPCSAGCLLLPLTLPPLMLSLSFSLSQINKIFKKKKKKEEYRFKFRRDLEASSMVLCPSG